MGMDKVVFADDRWGSDQCARLTRSDVTGSHVIFPLLYFPVHFLYRIFPHFSPVFSCTFFLVISRTFFSYLFPYSSPYFFSCTFFRHYFPVLFPVFFSVRFSRVFFWGGGEFFPYLFFRNLISYFFSYFLPVLFFPVLFQKSRRLKFNVLKYQWVFSTN
jgi:hypothetical protein